jgi:hypothetical protein
MRIPLGSSKWEKMSKIKKMKMEERTAMHLIALAIYLITDK